MRLRKSLLASVAALSTAGATAGLVSLTGTAAHAAPAPLPAHVYAPYFEMWTGDNPATMAQQAGVSYLTLAFLQTASSGSCTAYWNGDSGLPISQSSFGAAIAQIQANGGDVIPSFGGYTADTTNTEIADSCTDVNKIAQVFESLATTYNVTRIDLDIEANSVTNSAGIDRRNKAIKIAQDWAAANGRILEFQYTLPSTTSGLVSSGLNVLRNAKANGAKIALVNPMTFDYYDNQPHDMGADSIKAGTAVHQQIMNVFGVDSATAWGMVGVTNMPGIDDFGAAETFTLEDAQQVETWAEQQGIGLLSIWALQRDNGSCPGGGAADNCSGIAQDTWAFSHIFEQFTGGTRPSPTGNPTGNPTSTPTPTPTPTQPGSCTAPAWNASTVYTGGQQVSYNGHTWQAKWWTQGETPGQGGEWGVWTDKGACGGGGGTTPTPTAPPTPTATPTPTPTVTPTPTPTATPTPPSGVQPWAPGVAYTTGDKVTYNGTTYTCRQSHTSQAGWEPPNVPALWLAG